MRIRITAAVAAAAVIAGASAVSAQEIDDECRNQAEQAGVATTHNVKYSEEDNVCFATLIGRPMFGTPGFVPGAPAAPGLAGIGAGGVLAGAAAIGAIAFIIADETTATVVTPEAPGNGKVLK